MDGCFLVFEDRAEGSRGAGYLRHFGGTPTKSLGRILPKASKHPILEVSGSKKPYPSWILGTEISNNEYCETAGF